VGLVLRYYDPQAGTVHFDGHDVRNVDPRWLRKNIGVVTQVSTALPVVLVVPFNKRMQRCADDLAHIGCLVAEVLELAAAAVRREEGCTPVQQRTRASRQAARWHALPGHVSTVEREVQHVLLHTLSLTFVTTPLASMPSPLLICPATCAMRAGSVSVWRERA
jgi:hypothetical protein